MSQPPSSAETPATEDDDALVARARAFAVAAHAKQQYGGQSYVVHLDAVAGLLRPFGVDAQVIGYLHDVAEDTPVKLERIREEFGSFVAQCVELVTDPRGDDRRQRKIATNAKLAKVAGDAQLALVVKAADRLANLRQGVRAGSDWKLEMYRREHDEFRAAAFRAGLCDELWREIEQIISPEARSGR